jgi:hypothetical protein
MRHSLEEHMYKVYSDDIRLPMQGVVVSAEYGRVAVIPGRGRAGDMWHSVSSCISIFSVRDGSKEIVDGKIDLHEKE